MQHDDKTIQSFIEDAKFIRGAEKAQDVMTLIKPIVRDLKYGQVRFEEEFEPFLRDFRARDIAGTDPKARFRYLMAACGDDRIPNALAPLLAWACYHHSEDGGLAQAIYRKTGLAKARGIKFRYFNGKPRDRFLIRTGDRTEVREIDKSLLGLEGPAPEGDVEGTGDQTCTEGQLFDRRKTYQNSLADQAATKRPSDDKSAKQITLRPIFWGMTAPTVALAFFALYSYLGGQSKPLAAERAELSTQAMQTIQGIWGEADCDVTYYIKPTKTSIRMTSQLTEYALPPLEVEMSIRSVANKPEVFIEAFEAQRSDGLALVDVGISYIVKDGMETLTLDHHGARNQLDLVRCEKAR